MATDPPSAASPLRPLLRRAPLQKYIPLGCGLGLEAWARTVVSALGNSVAKATKLCLVVYPKGNPLETRRSADYLLLGLSVIDTRGGGRDGDHEGALPAEALLQLQDRGGGPSQGVSVRERGHRRAGGSPAVYLPSLGRSPVMESRTWVSKAL